MSALYRREQAFTLLELLVTLAIVAIVLTVVAPSLARLYESHRNASFLGTLRSNFNYARSLALKNNTITTLCPLNASTGACENEWRGDISIFVDSNNDKRPDHGDIKRVFSVPEGFDLIARPASKGYFQYTGGGLSHGTLGGLVICHNTSHITFMAYVAMNMGGRYRSATDENGQLKTSSGESLTCPS